MERKYKLFYVASILLILIINIGGIGYVGGAAIPDLKEELQSIYGEQYTNRIVENGIENMEFSIKPTSFFFTDYSFRWFWNWDYKYKCEVIYTVYSDGEAIEIRTITYEGISPMGYKNDSKGAYLNLESMKKTISK
ncbi:MAG: hypothetical protein IKM20_00945 [Erysipelotrichales bacterium]|nr:hypothetical protein [Erysipelotrichales bacterium]